MSRLLPMHILQLINSQIPELCITFVDPKGWCWSFRCDESEEYFNTWEETLIDFIAKTQDGIDKELGLFEED